MRMWDPNDMKVTLALIRHGETRANEEHRYLGKTDESLSGKGMENLLLWKGKNRYPEVDCLFASPMKRCLETAEILYPALHPLVMPEWKEMDFGRFEYKNYQELKEDTAYQAWIDGGGMSGFPGGEKRGDFIRRCGQGFDRMCNILCRRLEENGEKHMRAGAIVHGGTIMALLNLYGGEDYFAHQVSNGRGYLCRIEKQNYDIPSGKDGISLKIVRKI